MHSPQTDATFVCTAVWRIASTPSPSISVCLALGVGQPSWPCCASLSPRFCFAVRRPTACAFLSVCLSVCCCRRLAAHTSLCERKCKKCAALAWPSYARDRRQRGQDPPLGRTHSLSTGMAPGRRGEAKEGRRREGRSKKNNKNGRPSVLFVPFSFRSPSDYGRCGRRVV